MNRPSVATVDEAIALQTSADGTGYTTLAKEVLCQREDLAHALDNLHAEQTLVAMLRSSLMQTGVTVARVILLLDDPAHRVLALDKDGVHRFCVSVRSVREALAGS